jgi:hypothetical protein
MGTKGEVGERAQRKGQRRRLLEEGEFRRVIEVGKAFEGDRRSYVERRKARQDNKA